MDVQTVVHPPVVMVEELLAVVEELLAAVEDLLAVDLLRLYHCSYERNVSSTRPKYGSVYSA